MARPLRIEYPGAFYHVMNRGLERRAVFTEDDDYKQFISRCLEIHLRYGILFHSFCLMPNHYHLLIETPRAGLSKAMRHLNGFYTQYFNRKRKRVGPLFQGRYKAILVDKESYLLQLSRYIHLNPVKAAITTKPEDYRYSSYRFFLGEKDAPAFLAADWLLSQFGNTKSKARSHFHEFTMDGLSINFDPFKEVRSGSLMGSDIFCAEIKEKCLTREDEAEIPELKVLKESFDLKEYERAVSDLTPDESIRKKLLIYALRYHSPLSLVEIAGSVGQMTHHAVSKAATRLRDLREVDPFWKEILLRLDEKCLMSRFDPTGYKQ